MVDNNRICSPFAFAGYNEDGITKANTSLVIDLKSESHFQVKAEDAVKSLIHSWQAMHQYPRLVQWAWTSRGLVPTDDMKAMHPDSDKDELPGNAEGPAAFSEMVPGIPLIVPSPAPSWGCAVFGRKFKIHS